MQMRMMSGGGTTDGVQHPPDDLLGAALEQHGRMEEGVQAVLGRVGGPDARAVAAPDAGAVAVAGGVVDAAGWLMRRWRWRLRFRLYFRRSPVGVGGAVLDFLDMTAVMLRRSEGRRISSSLLLILIFVVVVIVIMATIVVIMLMSIVMPERKVQMRMGQVDVREVQMLLPAALLLPADGAVVAARPCYRSSWLAAAAALPSLRPPARLFFRGLSSTMADAAAAAAAAPMMLRGDSAASSFSSFSSSPSLSSPSLPWRTSVS